MNKAEITPQKKMSMVEEFLQEQTVDALLKIKNVGTRKRIIELSSILNQEETDAYKIPLKIAERYNELKKQSEKDLMYYKKIDSNFSKALKYLKFELKKLEKIEDGKTKIQATSYIRNLTLFSSDNNTFLSIFFGMCACDNLKDIFKRYKHDYNKIEEIKENYNSAIKKLNTQTEVAKKERKQEKIIAQLNQIVNNK